jgi:hypothetical protein
MDGGRQRANNVEVVFPESNVVGAAAEMDEDESESIEAEPARAAFQVDPHLL